MRSFTQDALRPLEIAQHAPTEALLLALKQSVPQGPPLRTRQRAEGLRLQATNVDWAWGEGKEVKGPAESLLLALTGRGIALAELTGEGVTLLAGRCTPMLNGFPTRSTLSPA